MQARALKTALEQRRKAVLVPLKVCRSWVDKFAKPVRQMLKRPAAASASPIPLVVKRHAGLGGRLGSVSLSCASASTASNSAPPKRPRSLQSLAGYKQVEEHVGDKYRSEVSDKGFGIKARSMRATHTELGICGQQRGVPRVAEAIPYGRWQRRRRQLGLCMCCPGRT